MVDRDQHAVGATLSEPFFFDHPTSPSGLYTSHDPVTGTRIATMVRASQKLMCVVFLVCEGATAEGFLMHAKAVLHAVEVDP